MAKGFGELQCPICGNEAVQRIDLDDCETFTCDNCGDHYTAEKVQELLDKWAAVLAWIATAPEQE